MLKARLSFQIQKKKQEKKDKRKVIQLLGPRKNIKIRKSQERMRKKEEEDKKKALLLSESMKNLEKYKISGDVYSLLQSSSNIGQVETVRGRRRREVQFSKAGLALPQNGQPLRTGVDSRGETGTDAAVNYISGRSAKIESLPKVIRDVPAFPKSSKELVDTNVLFLGGEAGNVSSVNEVAKESTHQEYKCDMSPKSTEIEKTKDHMSTSILVKCSVPSVVVHVARTKEVNAKRKDLPIIMMEQEIMEAINENPIVIICGATGCGKTTQVPQFLYEAGFGSEKSTDQRGIIGVTQPRRVAVIEAAKRVAFEMGVKVGEKVGYQVMHDCMVGKSCSIKFMTDGILMRELQSGDLLGRYSVLILDEAHERSSNTDILIGMLSRIVNLRQEIYEKQQREILFQKVINPDSKIYPLKVILMSATLRVEDFVSGNRIFCAPPPVIKVPTSQYPIELHFSKRTETDYIGQAYNKVLEIHYTRPPGGILIFVTGRREIDDLCRRLRKASNDIVENNSKRNIGREKSSSVSIENPSQKLDMEMIDETFDGPINRFSSYDEDNDDYFSDNSDFSDNLGSDSELEGITNDRGLDDNLWESFVDDKSLSSLNATFEDENKVVPSIPRQKSNQFAGRMCVLPLYAKLCQSEQVRVFEDIKEGERLIVVATNVAETSLTIPGIKYVVDTGKEKINKYNSANGMENFEISWISKASEAQRAGRAGRTGPGHCFHLYSREAYNKFDDFSCPEILTKPVDGVVLLLKSSGIGKVSDFPFPTPPERKSLIEAEDRLKFLKALDMKGKLTPLGKAMAHFPMTPRHSRMLLTVIQIMLRNISTYKNRANFVLGYAIATASALSLSNPFVTRFDEVGRTTDEEDNSSEIKEAFKSSREFFSNPSSDALTVAYALQCFELTENPILFCDEYALHLKTMEEMSNLRKQLLKLVFDLSKSCDKTEFVWSFGTIEDVERAWRGSTTEKSRLRPNEEKLLCKAICAGWADRVAKKTRNVKSSEGEIRGNATSYEARGVEEPIFLNRRSSVSKSAPEFLVYTELLYSKRPYINWATRVETEWIVSYAGSLCRFKDPKPYYDQAKDSVLCRVIPTFDTCLWQLDPYSMPIEDDSERVAIFAFSFLEGRVLPCLKSVRKFMRNTPSVILKSTGSTLTRVENLLRKLSYKSRIIDSCAKLRKAWDENPRELYKEVRDWFPQQFDDRFQKLWSEMQKEVKLEPKQRFPRSAKRKRS